MSDSMREGIRKIQQERADMRLSKPPPPPPCPELFVDHPDHKKHLQWAVQRLVTSVVEREAAFGMKLGEITWEAGCGDGDLSYPKGGRRLESLTSEDLVKVIDYVAEYIQRQET